MIYSTDAMYNTLEWNINVKAFHKYIYILQYIVHVISPVPIGRMHSHTQLLVQFVVFSIYWTFKIPLDFSPCENHLGCCQPTEEC